MASSLRTQYPWATFPIIASAPMAGYAGARMATAVSSAGGIGFIGSGADMKALSTDLESAASYWSKDSSLDSNLPVGVGFLLFAVKPLAAIPLLSQYRPAAVWLSCARTTQDFKTWTDTIRAASPSSRIWVQVPGVAAALEIAQICAPDILVLQSADAGGHGASPGAGIVSLIPEARDALDKEGYQNIPILASGGICEARGVAAALACGAQGVVMGTRFLACDEVELPVPEYQEAVLTAADGGVSTVRGTVFDELKGASIWPAGYDGRALVSESYKDHTNGLGIEIIREKHAIAAKETHKGFGGERRAAIWAGSGVGLVKQVNGAADIVREVRDGAKKVLELTIERL